METILQEQRRLKKRFDVLETAFCETNQSREANQEQVPSLPESIQLPANSYVKLQEIDEELNDESTYKAVVSQ